MKLRKKKKVEEEEDEVVVAAMKENDASIQAKVSAKAMDDTIVRWVIIDLTNTCVMDETPDVSNATIVLHQFKPCSSELCTTCYCYQGSSARYYDKASYGNLH